MAQLLKNLPAMQESQVQSLGWVTPLEKEIAIHSSVLVPGGSMGRGTGWATVHGVTKNRTQLSNFHFHFLLMAGAMFPPCSLTRGQIMVRVMPHGSQDSYIQCPMPSLDTHGKVWLSLLWALELLQQCENFFGIIVLQFVGCLLSSSMVG